MAYRSTSRRRHTHEYEPDHSGPVLEDGAAIMPYTCRHAPVIASGEVKGSLEHFTGEPCGHEVTVRMEPVWVETPDGERVSIDGDVWDYEEETPVWEAIMAVESSWLDSYRGDGPNPIDDVELPRETIEKPEAGGAVIASVDEYKVRYEA